MSNAEYSWKDNPVWADWGRTLVREHPDGLGDEPDFSKDGTGLFVWSRTGFAKYQEQMWKIGEFKRYPIGERTYEEYPKDSVEDQIYIAGQAFKLANAYWYFAKKEADQQAEKDREIALAAKEHEDETSRLSEKVAAADTMQELEIKATELRDRLSAGGNDTIYLHRQLSIVQARLIEIERKNARVNSRWAVAGFVVGVIGIVVAVAFPVWDLVHRAREPSHLNDQTTTSHAAPPN